MDATTTSQENNRWILSVYPCPFDLEPETVRSIQAFEARWGPVFLLVQVGDSPKTLMSLTPELFEAIRKEAARFPQSPMLILHSSGGSPEIAHKLALLFQQVCGDFSVMIPMVAKSGATLLSLAATKIYMTPTAACGPIDPIALDFGGENFSAITYRRAKECLQQICGKMTENLIRTGKQVRLSHNDLSRLLRDTFADIPLENFAWRCARSEDMVKEVEVYAKHLLKGKGYSSRTIKQITAKLMYAYANHNFPISFFDLTSDVGLNNVYLLSNEDQTLIENLMKSLPMFPCIGNMISLPHWQGPAVHHGQPRRVLDVPPAGLPASSQDAELEEVPPSAASLEEQGEV